MKEKSVVTKVFLGIALLASIAGAFYVTQTLFTLDKKSQEAKESARPANINITVISAPECTSCFNVTNAIASMKKQNILMQEEKVVTYNSSEGQDLIKQFGIKVVPTYIATGEIAKKNIESFIRDNGEVSDNTFIFTKVVPVYITTENNQEVGKVLVTHLVDSTCVGCINLKNTIGAYKKSGIAIVEEKEFSWNSEEGQKLIQQYAIEKIPTFIMSSDIAFYDIIKNSWQNVGTVESDGTYIARNIPLPYRDVSKGIVGLVDVIYLNDASCKECYRPEEVHKNILTQGFGIGIRSEKSLDLVTAAGKNLIAKYNITQVPTLLMSPQVSEYVNLKEIWSQVGTVEKDGWYVFRQLDQIGNVGYKDLNTNQVVLPQPSSENNLP